MQDLPCARNGRPPLTFPERLAGALATQVGSWRFLLIQSIFFAAWIVANVAGWIGAWDPYPFLLLDLLPSFQAAYIAPIIIISQNRQASIDRQRAISEYEINLKAALELKLLQRRFRLQRACSLPSSSAIARQVCLPSARIAAIKLLLVFDGVIDALDPHLNGLYLPRQFGTISAREHCVCPRGTAAAHFNQALSKTHEIVDGTHVVLQSVTSLLTNMRPGSDPILIGEWPVSLSAA